VSTPVRIEVELPLDADAANELGAQISAARFSSGAPALEAELPVADELQLGCCCVRVNFYEKALFVKADVAAQYVAERNGCSALRAMLLSALSVSHSLW
jgi:hypothetical protein